MPKKREDLLLRDGRKANDRVEEGAEAAFTANLIMCKVVERPKVDDNMKACGTEVSEVLFNIEDTSEGGNRIISPRITLDSSIFDDFLHGGKLENYEVTLEVKAVRTGFDQVGIATDEAPEEEEPKEEPKPKKIPKKKAE